MRGKTDSMPDFSGLAGGHGLAAGFCRLFHMQGTKLYSGYRVSDLVYPPHLRSQNAFNVRLVSRLTMRVHWLVYDAVKCSPPELCKYTKGKYKKKRGHWGGSTAYVLSQPAAQISASDDKSRTYSHGCLRAPKRQAALSVWPSMRAFRLSQNRHYG